MTTHKAQLETLIVQMTTNCNKLHLEVAELTAQTSSDSQDKAKTSEVSELKARMTVLNGVIEKLSKYYLELAGLQSFMEKNMLSSTKLTEIEVDLNRIEQEKFSA